MGRQDSEMAAPAESTTEARPAVLVVHLSGAHRGRTRMLEGDLLRIGTADGSDLHFAADREPMVAEHHATLERQGSTYLLKAMAGSPVRVNGVLATARRLDSGDLVQLGETGPILRIRLARSGSAAYKTMREAISDCVECARHSPGGRLDRLRVLVTAVPHELLRQTSPLSRATLLSVVLVLGVGLLGVGYYSWKVDRRLDAEVQRIYQVATVSEEERGRLTVEQLQDIRMELTSRLSSAVARVEALEQHNVAGPRVISIASRSVVFLQGAYGFLDPAGGKPLRIVVGSNGRPRVGQGGVPGASSAGNGPLLERLFTGTAFAVSEDGLLLTNRHVVVPWQFDESARRMIAQGLIPTMNRLIGYLPGVKQPFQVRLVTISETTDLAVLRMEGVSQRLRPLSFATEPPRPGQEVLVLGYPAGIKALLARTDPTFVNQLMQRAELSFWAVTRRLSEKGYIAPLATRGIVGQVTGANIVYDAETTHGGSGGPVLNLDREVIAVNAAILTDFGGSNLGIPADRAVELLARLGRKPEPMP
ncbi:MAG: trypsin-like peptidase domain-containing protein [Gemmatimonadota bacterium]